MRIVIDIPDDHEMMIKQIQARRAEGAQAAAKVVAQWMDGQGWEFIFWNAIIDKGLLVKTKSNINISIEGL